MDLITEYLALLTLYQNNAQVLHWKVCHHNFHKTHERYAEYYDQLNEYMDQTAEQMITIGMSPLNMSGALDVVSSSDFSAFQIDPAKNYAPDVADNAFYSMFSQLHDISLKLADEDDLPDDVQDVFMDHARWFRIEGLYKLGRAIQKPNPMEFQEPPKPEEGTPPIPEEEDEF